MLRANNREVLAAILVIFLASFCVCLSASAQGLVDWVLDPVETATNCLVDEVSKQANNAWENYLDEKIKQSLSEDAQKLANFPIDTTALDSIDNIYNMHTHGDGQFKAISERQSQLINSYLYCSSKMPIGLIGRGAVRNKIIENIEKLQYPAHQITPIELLNYNHPEISDLCRRWGKTCVAKNGAILYYWAIIANRLDSLYPSKISFPKPQQLSMTNAAGNNYYVIVSAENGQILGEISCEREVVVRDATLLNMAAMPNAIYLVGEIKYKTDYLGRVTSVSYLMARDSKRKSTIKGKIKAPKILVTYGSNKKYKPFELIPQKYNGSVGRLNIVPIEQTADNKSSQKALTKCLKQEYKNCKKNATSVPVTFILRYTGRNECPQKITANVGNEYFYLTNTEASQLAQIKLPSPHYKQALKFSTEQLPPREKMIAPSLEQIKKANYEYTAETTRIENFIKPIQPNTRVVIPQFGAETKNTLKINRKDESPSVVIATPQKAPVEEEEEEVVYVTVEKMPEFPGGQFALSKYLSDNVKYPKVAQECGIQGRVICQFVVNRDGSIADVEIIRSGGDPSLDKEAVRVIKSMPKWKPGQQRGKPVRVKYTVPVNFKLQ